MGLEPSRFWTISPREVARELTAAVKRQTSEHNARAWAVWHIAALGRAKDFPKLNELMIDVKPKPIPRQSIETEIALAMAWVTTAQRN